MRKIDGDEIDSSQSEDLRDQELIGINKHNRSRRSSKNSKVTAQMEELYKSALLDSFFGKFQQASKKLKKYIQTYPDSPQAFHTLGTMYEQLNEDKNAAQYYAMSAFLSPPNIQKWKNAAQKSFNVGLYSQAAYCYGRALKIENYNTQIMEKRAKAFELCSQFKKAISTYKKILSITFSLSVLKQYARLRFHRQQYQISRQILLEYQNHQKDPHVSYMICQTYLKQNKMQQLLEYLQKFIQNRKRQQQNFSIDSLFIQFIILIYVALVKLGKKQYGPLNLTINQIKNILIQSYEDQSYSKQYEALISQLKGQEENCFEILVFLIKYQSHQTVENFLLLSQFYKKRLQYEQSIKILKQALNVHKNSIELRSQLNHIKVISGDKSHTKNKRRLDYNNIGMTSRYNPQKSNLSQAAEENNEDIFYSDQQNNVEGYFFGQNQTKQNQRIKDKKQRDQSFLYPKSIQTQDPQMIKRLLQNSNQTIQSIIKKQGTNGILNSFKQVQSCVILLTSLSQVPKAPQQEQKQGLFRKNHKRRRYFTSKQHNRQDVINKNIQTIIEILQTIVEYIKILVNMSQFSKARIISQSLSKAYFFKWQNRSPELKRIKQKIFQIGLLSCLVLQKYETAVYFIRYLAHKQPQNSFYLLVVNYLIHNSSTKICMSNLLGKYLQKNPLQKNNSNGIIQDKIKIHDEQQKIKEKDQNYFEDLSNNFQQVSDDALSYPRKMSNISNLSDLLRQNIKIHYLFGIQYMQTGCFELALSSFLKIVNYCQGQIRKTVWLCISCCFLQISSSRTCHSKLPFTNRSTYCFWEYINSSQDSIQKQFNKARFFAQVKLNFKAIKEFTKLLEMEIRTQSQRIIQQRSAYSLVCIYKQIQDWDMVNKINEKYFSLQSQNKNMNILKQVQSQYQIEVQ